MAGIRHDSPSGDDNFWIADTDFVSKTLGNVQTYTIRHVSLS